MTKLEKKEKRLEDYYVAESKILLSQAYQSGGNSMTRTNLKQVQDKIDVLEAEIERMGSGRKKGARAISIIPRG